ncbi:MAG: SIS domain-containing protein, partial [Candidatus Xenobia bacterium]
HGDIDNYATLRARYERETGRIISPSITTDTKIIPVMVSYYYEKTGNIDEAFRMAVDEFEGSLAIIMHTSIEPGKTWLALRGSGQSLCVGLMEDGFIVASELYGCVELAHRFVRMDGMRERIAGDPHTRGQIFAIDSTHEPGLPAIAARSFDGAALQLTDADLKPAEITTRDINRGQFTHYLLKEINEAPRSIQRTLAGKFRLDEKTRHLTWSLDASTVPPHVAEGLAAGRFRRIVLMGQGTAGVAGDCIASAMENLLPIPVVSTRATEFSGYHMAHDLSDTLVIAVSQSGTTTDTNRTIDLCRNRGAIVLGIVNRRNSDLVYKVDGVLYTSDGRDIEMSVASTKAFYSQVTAGYLLALYFADLLHSRPREAVAAQLKELMELPKLMASVLARHEEVRELAFRYAPFRKDWAVAGSGSNRGAADEIRIKLSELCYKSIATDSIEDKKHIDLSSEPLVLVCAAGLPPVALKDAVKEVAIFKSHKSCPIVIASDGAQGFEPYAAGIIRVPEASEAVSVLLNTLVGHLWGYYSALAIDTGASILRQARAVFVRCVMETMAKGSPAHAVQESVRLAAQQVLDALRSGRFNSSLLSDKATALALLVPYVQGRLSLASFAEEFGQEAAPLTLYQTAVQTLSDAISDLNRPVDAIKHQAKTITVGISRSEERLEGVLFEALQAAHVPLEGVSYKDLMLLRALTPAVEEVPGTTRYRIVGLGTLGELTPNTRIRVEARTGISAGIPSRTDGNPALSGAKGLVVSQRTSYIGVGKSDGRPIAILPLISKGVCDGILLLHLKFVATMPMGEKVELLQGLTNRYDALRALVTEANLPWQDTLLADVSPQDLCTTAVEELARTITAGRQQLV